MSIFSMHLTCLSFLILSLFSLIGLIDGACTGIPSNAVDLKIKITNTGNDWEVTCTETHWVFVNNVRSVDGVNITDVDVNGRITGSCSTGSNVPNVFLYLGAEREFYCQPGCNPLHGEQWKVTYPEEVYSRESWSPPVRPIAKTVSVQCADGYGRKIGDKGATETSCSSSAGWTVTNDNLISCTRGCNDITTTVEHAETTASPSVTDGNPPFSTGDIVPFNCKAGYVLVGYATVTCDSMGSWNSPLPQCVVVSSSVSIFYSTTYIFLNAAILLVLSLLPL
ncbi:hypothetical protein ACHWQZ_G002214 [Mnemiopsis leidyi]